MEHGSPSPRAPGRGIARLIEDLKAGAAALGRIAFGKDGELLSPIEKREMLRCRARLLTFAVDLEFAKAVVYEAEGRTAPFGRRCRECGCTEEDCSGCVRRTGRPCVWFEEDLCSACALGGRDPQIGLRDRLP